MNRIESSSRLEIIGRRTLVVGALGMMAMIGLSDNDVHAQPAPQPVSSVTVVESDKGEDNEVNGLMALVTAVTAVGIMAVTTIDHINAKKKEDPGYIIYDPANKQ